MFTPQSGNAFERITKRDNLRLQKILPGLIAGIPLRRTREKEPPAMPRIPEAEIERLKSEVSVERLVGASGIELKKSGRDWLGRCPFHEDDTASLVVTPAKNLWHCFGCGIGGGPIDWVIKRQGVSFRQAVELLREGLTPLAAQTSVKRSTVRSLPPPVAFDADDQALLNQTVGYYHERLLATTEAAEYLAARGLAQPELIGHFKLGVADRTLGLRLPEKNRKAGGEIRARLQKIGLIRDSGHEHFNGSLVVPVFDEAGDVVEVYGRKLLDNLRAGTPKHLYLPAREGRGRGVFNLAGLHGAKEVILCEALIDALTFWCAGFRNVTASYGIEGFTEEHVAAFKRCGTERVLIAYDRDDAGERGAARVAERLLAEGIECLRVQFPKGMDANEYALKVHPADKALGLLLRKAVWLGKGQAPQAAPGEAPTRPSPAPTPPPAAKEPEPTPEPAAPLPPASSLAAAPPAEPPPAVPAAEIDGDALRLVQGARTWLVRGLPKANPGASMKLNVRVQGADGALHVDSVDLYAARARAVFAAQAAAELGGRDTEALAREIARELGRLLLAVEQAIAERERAASAPKPVLPAMTEAEHDAALELLQSPELIPRILADFAAVGLVGEDTNKLVGYLAAVSRKLDRPLGVVIQSSSAAGKTTLMDAVLGFVPEEDRVKYSAMTGQSLFYMGETNLKHKALAIVEEEGASRASYALKLLQSEGELTIASTGKDPASGNLITQQYRVEGPVALLFTTTARDLDEELMNRCLVLAVDEGREQTRAIHERQRERRTLAGLFAKAERHAVTVLHQHAQRLLRPLEVLNPYAQHLSFPDQTTRLRRDHEKYLTLIDVIALLHQHQRPIRSAERAGRCVEYIEASLADIALANTIAHEVLGRSLDELPPQTRRLLVLVDGHVGAECERQRIRRTECRFTRRALREAIAWGDTQLKVHLARLVELEYMAVHRTRSGGFEYELVYELAEDCGARLAGLADIEELQHAYDSARSGQTDLRSAPGRAPVGPRSGPGRGAASGAEPVSMRVPGDPAGDEAEPHFQAMPRAGTSYTNGAGVPLLAAGA
jgi:DNA primase